MFVVLDKTDSIRFASGDERPADGVAATASRPHPNTSPSHHPSHPSLPSTPSRRVSRASHRSRLLRPRRHGGVSQSRVTSPRREPTRGGGGAEPRRPRRGLRRLPREVPLELRWNAPGDGGRGVLDRGARGGIGQRARDRARRTKRATRDRRAARVLRGTIGGRTPREACHPSSRSRTWKPGTCSSPWDFETWGERRREGGAAEVSPDRVSEGGRTGDERVGG